jgi:hypothetical protein
MLRFAYWRIMDIFGYAHLITGIFCGYRIEDIMLLLLPNSKLEYE